MWSSDFKQRHQIHLHKTEKLTNVKITLLSTVIPNLHSDVISSCRYTSVFQELLITVAARSKAWTVFARSKVRYRGFESQLRHGCLCAFILFVLSCVQAAALLLADPPSKESYRLCSWWRNVKAAKVQQRAVEPYIHRFKKLCIRWTNESKSLRTR
jgi:hypothetical protein